MRRTLMQGVHQLKPGSIDFLEFAPENWLGVGGRWAKLLRSITEQYPCIAHGLSLSLGSPAALDMELLARIRSFLEEHQILLYSEHLSYTSDEDSQLYELLPIPFTRAAVRYVAERILQVQDFLNQRIAVEQVSYYLPVGGEMSEQDFVCEVLEQADCYLLLDVNNLYCNSHNHAGDPLKFLQAIPENRVAYFHLAGHRVADEDTVIDTHGAAVSDPVWHLLDQAFSRFGPVPTLLERDSNIPPLSDLLIELEQIKTRQQALSLH